MRGLATAVNCLHLSVSHSGGVNCPGFTASVERASEHLLVLAIIRAAEDRGIETASAADFESPTGKGAHGMIEGRHIPLGNARFLAGQGVDTAPLADEAERLHEDGATVIFMGVDGRATAIFSIADRSSPRPPKLCPLCGLKGSGWSC